MSDTPVSPAAASIANSIVGGKAAGTQSRYFKDNLARWVVWTGGLGVIVALMLIFVYLLSEVFPLFKGAEFEQRQSFVVPGGQGKTLYFAAEEQGEVGMRLTDSGAVTFFDLYDGKQRGQIQLPLGEQGLVGARELSAEAGTVGAQLSDGSVLVFRHKYLITYPNDKRLITPEIEYPFGEAPLAFMSEGGHALALREERGTLLMAAADTAGSVHLRAWEKQESLMGDVSFDVGSESTFAPPVKPDLLLIEPLLSWLYVIDRAAGKIAFYKLDGGNSPQLVHIYDTGAPVEDARYLAGGISIVVAQANGVVSQWFPARDKDGNHYLARVREFDLPGGKPITAIGPEMRRRGFAVGDSEGHVAVYYATAERLIEERKVLDGPVKFLSFNPRAQYLAVLGADGKLAGFDVHNEHPEVSFKALWGKVWYESYDDEKWLWQSSSASSDFEPKFSMTPLSVGTIKGAFYAMIFAIPLAVLGAIFTANFMSPEMRQVVKPSVEVLAALPSVILGFLAGLWLAPFVETNLPGVFLTLLLLPLSIPIFGYVWTRMPRSIRLRTPAGWEAAMLIPVIAVVVWFCFAIAKPLEAMAFGGNMQAWMDHTLGIGYDQRNALVVGIAMGIAVIPVIFSIAEDAIFSVPRQLSLGSLALGATPWQTLVGVVLPTASPGIFSAVMIGMGRAVGETMIVLMATGNTPVTDFSMFQGMRTFAANIAVEMPESEVGSTHFRLLFFAGLVLFLFTFVLNTLAEVVRQRLRKRYSNL
ncbi:ABC transporter permease subunit [Solimonas sp. K1W22B-7]|uniref:ABC transporter permease subunit n=1 Tax=Solimonas sp. K1W22B-7 TaxID=2303331 RepID=UPI000E32FA8C|nr:ABC transporter permease subunit [Solimonas sp. K1W22B-7]AXQ29063.1 ABC transporter permease subunit [Solimonas sp. K1W22B-7]